MSNNCVFENRMGKFKLSERVLNESSNEQLAELFGLFVVVDVDVRWYNGAELTYTAYSPMFEKLEEGYVIPFYDIVGREIDGKITIDVERIG